jgi:hypothetical protein
LRRDLLDQIRAIAGSRGEGDTGQFGFDATQLQAPEHQIRFHRSLIGVGDFGVHAQQHLARFDFLPVPHQDFPQHAGVGRLHDLHVAAGNELALRDCDDVEPPDAGPRQHHRE